MMGKLAGVEGAALLAHFEGAQQHAQQDLEARACAPYALFALRWPRAEQQHVVSQLAWRQGHLVVICVVVLHRGIAVRECLALWFG